MYKPRPAELVLALELGLKHSPSCRQYNEDFNLNQVNAWFQRSFCYCDFFEKLDRAIRELIREDMANGVTRNLEEE